MNRYEIASAVAELTDDRYGPATTDVKRITSIAQRLEWFPPVISADEDSRAQQLLSTHVDMTIGQTSLSCASSALPTARHLAKGDWRLLAETYVAANRSTDDDPAYARGPWRLSRGEIARGIVEKERCTRIVPPLFPVTGNATITAGMITADRAMLRGLVSSSHYRETVWLLMCDVEQDFWSALLWTLVHNGEADRSPFHSLVELYALGYYPLGIVGDRLVTFHRQ